MRKFLIALFYILVGSVYLHAQNWPIIRGDLVSYFQNNKGNIGYPDFKAVFTDTTYSSGGDSISIVRKSPSYNGLFGKCLPMVNIFFGPKFTKNESQICFFNSKLDSLKINLNDTIVSTLLIKSDSLKYSVFSHKIGISEELVLGKLDSVLNFKFYVIKFSGDTFFTHPLSTINLKISKTYGVIETPAWNEFPYLYYYPNAFFLIGVLEKNGLFRIGITNKYDDHYFEHKEGDEIHEEYFQGGWVQRGTSSYSERIRTQIIILGKAAGSENVTYNAARKLESVKYLTYLDKSKPDTKEVVYKNDIIYISTSYNKSKYPYTLKSLYTAIIGSDFYGNYFDPNLQKWIQYDLNTLSNGNYFFRDSCWFAYPEANEISRYYYYDSIGGPYYQHSLYGSGTRSNTLVYFKSGSFKYGTPIGLDNLNQPIRFKIYPNPTSELINIESDFAKPINFELRNLSSQLVLSKQILGIEQISLSHLDNGIYFYLIKSEDQNINQVGRIVVFK